MKIAIAVDEYINTESSEGAEGKSNESDVEDQHSHSHSWCLRYIPVQRYSLPCQFQK